MRGKTLLGLAALAGLGLIALKSKAEAEGKPHAPPSPPPPSQPPQPQPSGGGAPHHGGVPHPLPMTPPHEVQHTVRRAVVSWNEFRVWATRHGMTIPEAWEYYRWLARRR